MLFNHDIPASGKCYASVSGPIVALCSTHVTLLRMYDLFCPIRLNEGGDKNMEKTCPQSGIKCKE